MEVPVLKSGFYIENLGCAKNQVDAEIMISALSAEGIPYCGNPEDAGIIIVNTCGFIDKAKEESINTIIELKKRFPQAVVIAAGCLSERYRDELSGALDEADAFFGNRAPAEIGRVLRGIYGPAAESGERPALFPEARGRYLERKRFFNYPGSAYLKIAEGCSNHCSYCAIPIIRGELESRDPDDIVGEFDQLLAAGIREVNLVSQDLASYGRDRGAEALADLFTRLLGRPEAFWLRMLYIHPDHFPYRVLDLCREDPRLLPYFDLPFQHASARVLRDMGRRGDSDTYLSLIYTIRKSLPAAVIRSTFMTGFPGESDEDFEQLMNFVRDGEPDWAGFFSYSREEGTPAALLDRGRRHVKKRTAEQRLEALQQLQGEISRRRLDAHIGTTMDILVEEQVEGEALFIGRAYLHAPEVDGLVVLRGKRISPGEIVKARIIRRNGIDLEAAAGETE